MRVLAYCTLLFSVAISTKLRALIGASIFISTVVFGSVIIMSPVNKNTISKCVVLLYVLHTMGPPYKGHTADIII